MDKKIGWGICGCGGIAARMAGAIAQVPGCRLHAVAARDPARAKGFAVVHGAQASYGSYLELIADPEVTVVYVANVHSHHYPVMRRALEAGKAVLCEKPLVITEAQARTVVELARSNGTLLIEAMWIRFQPAVRSLRERIAAGVLGQLSQVRCDFSFHTGFDPKSRLFDPLQAGGVMLDLGCYPLAMIQDFLGPITGLEGFSELGSSGVDENIAFVTRHGGGGLGIGTAGVRGIGTYALEISGSKGIATAPSAIPPTEISIRRDRASAAEEVLRDNSGVDGFVHTVRETARCLAAGLIESPYMTHAQSVELARWMEASWRRGKVVYPAEILKV